MIKTIRMSHKTDFTITDAQAGDIPDLVNLLNDLFTIEQDFTPDEAKQAVGLKRIIQNPNNAIVKVAKNKQGQVIGMVSAQLVISSAQGSGSAWIEDMIVEQDYRANGIGRALLNAVIAWAKAKGATRAQLLVDLDNTAAVGYYNHLGWESSRMGMRRIILK